MNLQYWGLSNNSVIRRATKLMYKVGWKAVPLLANPLRGARSAQSETVMSKSGVYGGVYRYGSPAYIEPHLGYVISAGGQLIEPSILPNFPFGKPPWQFFLPSPLTYFQLSQGRPAAAVVRVERAISLRHLWEWNYYHFFADVLGKLGVFDEAGLDPSIPVVIGRYALDLPFVREALTYGKLKNRTWIIQDNSYVFADEIYYCQTWQSFSERFDYLLDEMELQHPSPDGGRTYLTRGKQFARRVENEDEVIKLLREYDFEIVDTAGMSLEAQIRLFARTRYLVAIHGAGLINIIFRRHAPLHVLELHAANYRTEDFRDICLESNYRHDTLGGAPTDPGDPQGTNFTVDLQRLREKLELMVA